MITYQFSDQITIDWLVKNMPQFLFPDLSKQQKRIQKKLVGVIAIQHGQPIGLVLASSESTQTIYRIHSFLVHPSYRQQKIGANIIQQLEKNIRQHGGKKIEGIYRSHWQSVPYIKRILEQQKWSKPQAQLIFVKGKGTHALTYFGQSKANINTFSFLPFTHLKKSDQIYVQKKQQLHKQWFDPDLDPFLETSTIHPTCSFFLKKEDEIIGWIVSHQIKPDLNEITALFIDEEHRSYGLAYQMIQIVLQTQVRLGIPNFLVTAKMNGNPIAKLMIRGSKMTDMFCTMGFYSHKFLDER